MLHALNRLFGRPGACELREAGKRALAADDVAEAMRGKLIPA